MRIVGYVCKVERVPIVECRITYKRLGGKGNLLNKRYGLRFYCVYRIEKLDEWNVEIKSNLLYSNVVQMKGVEL
jgi:hypothetical protein